jgi:hypothetical protein
MTRRLATLTLALAAGAGLAPAAAQTRPQLQPLLDQAPLAGGHFRDAVISRAAARGRLAHASASLDFKAYPTSEGYSVGVAVSARYATFDPAVAQTYVSYLDSLPHSTELRRLGIYIAPADEVLTECGGQAGTLACYDSGSQIMIVPGEQTDSGYGVTTSYVITHEYGHHIANHRSNAPFDAFSWGPKYWASYEMVCDRTAKALLAPGNEADFYDRNPGEGWAETYAHMKYPDQPWQLTPILQPDTGAFAAAAKDISDLWHGPVTKVFRGSFGRGGSSTRSFKFTLNLDGALSVRLKGPSASNYNLQLSSTGGGGGRTSARGSRDAISYKAACRTQPSEVVTVTVKRVTGSGPFSARLSYDG